MRTRPVARLALIAVLVAGVAAACGNDSSSSTTTERKTATTAAAKNFQVSTPDGQVSLSLDGKLPPGWPSSFPLPDSTDTAGSGSLAGSSSGAMVGVFSTKKSGQDAYDFYTSETSLKPTDEKSVGSNNFLGSMTIASPYPGSVTVAEISGSTYIVVLLDTGGKATTTTAAGAGSPTASTASTTTTSTGG